MKHLQPRSLKQLLQDVELVAEIDSGYDPHYITDRIPLYDGNTITRIQSILANSIVSRTTTLRDGKPMFIWLDSLRIRVRATMQMWIAMQHREDLHPIYEQMAIAHGFYTWASELAELEEQLQLISNKVNKEYAQLYLELPIADYERLPSMKQQQKIELTKLLRLHEVLKDDLNAFGVGIALTINTLYLIQLRKGDIKVVDGSPYPQIVYILEDVLAHVKEYSTGRNARTTYVLDRYHQQIDYLKNHLTSKLNKFSITSVSYRTRFYFLKDKQK